MIRVESILPIARDRLLTIHARVQLTEAAESLTQSARHMVVVCDDARRMVGVVTRTDVVRQIGHCQGCACTTACATVMTRKVFWCRPDDWLHEVWAVMKDKGLRSVPIVDSERRPLGLLSARDALEMLLSEVVHEEELLKDYVMSGGYQ